MSTVSGDRGQAPPEAGRAPAHSGVVVSVRGSVVDVRFDAHLPPIFTVLRAGDESGIDEELFDVIAGFEALSAKPGGQGRVRSLS